MKQAIKCALGLHQYEIYAEEIITNIKEESIGKIIINRCKFCGKLKQIRIITNKNYII